MTSESPSTSSLFVDYPSSCARRDEMRAPDGSTRPHWQPVLNALQQLGRSEFVRRWDEAKLLIHENGVTYNVHGDPRGMDRPWQLDPIPALVAPAEAAAIEAALIQRGLLLERILADLYGPQTLLRDRLVPPGLVFANPGFLRPCHGVAPPGERRLHLYAANLGRGPGDETWVLGDRTQAPSGAGYALENRIVLSRMLPDVFRDCNVQRLALFFRTLRDTLRSIAPHNRDNPRIVLLTPGPYNETYFEHAYLARYLGYTLVEGGDLTVRDNRVYLKVLGGLQPVDVIFRRLDDDFCDPLELRPDSFLGVPGLVQAIRSGNVAVGNALGSGVLESPAFLGYLPALCRHLLGEDLRMRSVPTWWCGDPMGQQHVLTNLSDMVIKPAFPGSRLEPVFGNRLTHEDSRALAERIRARPNDFVGQERLELSTIPVLVGDRLQPRAMVVRAYLAAKEDSFAVMPGGLTRVSASADDLVVSMRRGGGSKDTWVLSDAPVNTFSLLRPQVQPVELSRGGSDLPSRAADNLYWLGRYAERAEGMTRLARGILVRLTEKSGLAEAPELPSLLKAIVRVALAEPDAPLQNAELPALETTADLLGLLFDAKRPGSLAGVVRSLLQVGGIARDRISMDMWRVLGNLEFREAEGGKIATPADSPRSLGEILDRLNRNVLTLSAFGGLAMDSMTRTQGWRFLDMGRRLERALHTVILVRATTTTAAGQEGPLLESLLEIADSAMTYRRRYLGSLQTAAVLDLLLADETNPRSLAFQLVALADDVDNLPRESTLPGRSPEQRLMLGMLSALRLADIEQLTRLGDDGRRTDLDKLLARIARALPELSDRLTHGFLSHLQTSRNLAGLS